MKNIIKSDLCTKGTFLLTTAMVFGAGVLTGTVLQEKPAQAALDQSFCEVAGWLASELSETGSNAEVNFDIYSGCPKAAIEYYEDFFN